MTQLSQRKQTLELIQLWQRDGQWEAFADLVANVAHSAKQLGSYSWHVYGRDSDPTQVAIKNELTRAFQQGMVYTLTLVQQELTKTAQAMARLEKEDEETVKDPLGEIFGR